MNPNHYSLTRLLLILLAAASLLATPLVAGADDNLPWGSAEKMDRPYEPRKVVYDVYTSNARELEMVMDRVSMLNNVYEADPFDSHIVMVLHGAEVPLFTRDEFDEHEELMRRARSLTQAGNIEFRMCEASARLRGIDVEDVHGFVNVVPMADAEIIELQHEGYLFMQ
ncbi:MULTISPECIES: DsrE family protein [unclassified Thioalkalivibrio]|uniref:DsrE family protein n=1 Tax=unclassified Thioalkalivibrio TaxID=2621013 RepID=UPI00037346E7|nr:MULTISPECIES: DsrE family protein [unclassified Thioalkalivibrio]